MRRLVTTSLSAVFSKVKTFDNRKGIEVELSDGRNVQLPVAWLLDANPADRHITGQKATTFHLQYLQKSKTQPLLEQLPCVQGASIDKNGGIVNVQLSDEKNVVLRSVDLMKYGLRPSCPKEQPKQNILRSFEDLKVFDFKSYVNDPKVFAEAIASFTVDGMIGIDGCGTSNDALFDIVKKIDKNGPMRTLYGLDFFVESVAQSGPVNNVAYSTEFLDLHVDLVYLQSCPSLQLLHCQKNDETVVGGEGIFLDCLAAATDFQQQFPAAFQTLSTVPAAFMKDDFGREPPAQYYGCFPHFRCNHEGAIIDIRWAPAFEAPLPLTTSVEETEKFFEAKHQFVNFLEERKKTHLIKFRYHPGFCVIFNNLRMLHGREKFAEGASGSRKLHGCYINTDNFWSTSNVIGYHGLSDNKVKPSSGESYATTKEVVATGNLVLQNKLTGTYLP